MPDEPALNDPEILRLSTGMVMRESDEANAVFPGKRLARVILVLQDGTRLESGWMTPRWDATEPPTEAEITAKFHDLADPVLGPVRAAAIAAAVENLPETGLAPLTDQLFRPISPATTSSKSA